MRYSSVKRSLALDLFLLLVFYQCNESRVVNSISNYSSEEPEEVRNFHCNSSQEEDIFHCDNAHCIPKRNVCNNVRDCVNGEDESVQHCGCLQNEFQCSNSCIDLLNRCDRNKDCPSGEDEENCGTYQCPTTHFKCENDFCIPIELTCNFVDDCGDNSDEYAECSHRDCYKGEFRCKSGQCIRAAHVCDNQTHCYDNSDEEECSPENFVECGDGRLVHKFFWCDGWADCRDNHADELNCGECTAGDTFFSCSNGRCIRRANVCDGYCDCLDQSLRSEGSNSTCEDEQDCEEFYTVKHGLKSCNIGISINCITKFSLQATRELKYRCIHGEYICDGVNDCQNGNPSSDELGCNATDYENENNYFRCDDGRYLPSQVRCNHEFDCLSGEDEDNCTFIADPKCQKDEKRCRNRDCLGKSFFCDGTFDCSDRSDEMQCHDLECPHGFKRCIHGGQCFSANQWCDYYVDCPDGSDEEDCIIENCTEDEFQCRNGQCINKSKQCVNTGSPKSGCADGSHLTNCENQICGKGFYKCYRGPCIDESLICNGKIDCTLGWDDENNCTFKCAESNPDCECRDKHLNCTNLMLTSFPRNIEKQITWFHLSGNKLYQVLTNETFYHFNRLLYLDLSNNNITTLIPYMFEKLWRLNTLYLQNNNIQVLENGTFYGLSKLNGLHLDGNKIRVLKSWAFYGLSSLKTLSLQKQRIDEIQKGSFVGLKRLTTLDLSQNNISSLKGKNEIFIGMPSLMKLDLRNNPIKSIESNVFKVINNLNFLFFDEFRFCCVVKHVKSCYPPPDEFSSCEDLMSNSLLRICIWILGITATFANLSVIIFRTLWKGTNKDHAFLIKNLALGDLFMGIYLLIIASVDLAYRDKYSIHDSEWRSSQLCSFAGFLSTFSSELSVFTLTVITLDRLLAITYPFRRFHLKSKFLMILGWVLAASISVIPHPIFQIEYFRNFFGRSGVCLPLHITSDKPNGWQYSVFVFLILNFISFMIIAGSYLWMFLVAKRTREGVGRNYQRSQRSDDKAMAFRMTLLVATDAACWFPIILLGILSLAGVTIPPQVFAWVAVFVLPLNAALNPVLYTLSTAAFMNPTRAGLLSFSRSFSRNDRSYYNSTAVQCNNTHDCATTEEYYSEPSILNSRSWRPVDIMVRERGEIVPLRQTKRCTED